MCEFAGEEDICKELFKVNEVFYKLFVISYQFMVVSFDSCSELSRLSFRCKRFKTRPHRKFSDELVDMREILSNCHCCTCLVWNGGPQLIVTPREQFINCCFPHFTQDLVNVWKPASSLAVSSSRVSDYQTENKIIVSENHILQIVMPQEILFSFQLLLINIFSFHSNAFIYPTQSDINSVVLSNSSRQLCSCSSPCEMPSSLTVVDAVMDEPAFDDNETLSSGDEIDKFESDTDSQDTVIEGEAYKRMRNVAIKEKILQANEEHFNNFQSLLFTNNTAIEPACKKKVSHNSGNKLLCESGKLLLVPGNDSYLKSLFIGINPQTNERHLLMPNFILHDENISSESSENGSDVEELVLSDTSSSSDETVYISKTSTFAYRNVNYKLHTIAEESCEESDRSSAVSCLSKRTAQSNSKFSSSKIKPTKTTSNNTEDVLEVKLSSAHLKNNLEHKFSARSFDDDVLTDESGGISDEDDNITSYSYSSYIKNHCKKKSSLYLAGTAQSKETAIDFWKRKEIHGTKLYEDDLHDTSNERDTHLCKRNGSRSFCERDASDDEARYIMNHVLQQIINKNECLNDESSVSPTMEMLESKITRLMQTVSPVSLVSSEPSSSSCSSSTIGSNNSDYGSDTLESCETDEESVDSVLSDQQNMLSNTETGESLHVSSDCSNCNIQSDNNLASSEVADETMYICKQLVASLKKIADNADANIVSNELSKAEICEDTAKQYIADQIAVLMQTVSTSQNNSPMVGRFSISKIGSIIGDTVNNHDQSDSDSPQLNEFRDCCLKNKTPSESGSETTISASISIPSYDDSDRTPTESEISHEMDELYALLESNGAESGSLGKMSLESNDMAGGSLTCENESSSTRGLECSLLFGAASKLESLLPISIEERIAMYTSAFINKEKYDRQTEMRINVMLPHDSDNICIKSSSPHICMRIPLEISDHDGKNSSYNIEKEKSAIPAANHSISEEAFSMNIQQAICSKAISEEDTGDPVSSFCSFQNETGSSDIIAPLPKVINPKEKASSENDLLVANYRAKSKNSKVFGTKSAGNISDFENMNGKSAFRDTGYYSFKSSDESFLSLDDSTNSRTSTTSLTQYRSLTSTETIPEEEETNCKVNSPAKISLSSGNIPYEVCDASASKSSTLPPSLRGKLCGVNTSSHRSRSSFFSTSGVLRKLTLLRDESGNSLRSSPHGRMRIRHRTLSGGSEDSKQSKEPSIPAQRKSDTLGASKDADDEQVFSYHSRSQMSLSSFGGGRSGSITSVYSAAGGGRYGTVNVTGEVCFSTNYIAEMATFELFIKECHNLASVDSRRNRSDPYVKVYLLPDRTKSGKRKTKVKKHTLNPVFEEMLKFQVKGNELDRRTLWLSVWHSDRFGRNDFLGEVMLPLSTFETKDLKWYTLQEKLDTLDTPSSYSGDLILALKYIPPDSTVIQKSQKKNVNQKGGALHVLIKEARNLMATRTNGTSDPFCKSYLLPDRSKSGKQKTPVFKKTCNPKWNHTFVYENMSLDDLRSRCLELTVWDYDKITSNDFLGGVRLCLGTGVHIGREVDWMDSVGEEVSLWYTMLERPNMWVDGSLLLRSNMQNRKIC